MKTRIKRPLCLGAVLALLIGLFPLSAGAENGQIAPQTVGYSADRIGTTSPPDTAVDILTLEADGSNYASVTATDFFIKDAEGLVRLSAVTNKGKNFSGKIVWLKNNIDMRGITDFQPIGNWTQRENEIAGVDLISSCFSGTFDGLGHRISGLVMESDSGVMHSLFGVIRGAQIRNLVIDETCRFSYTGTDSWARTAAVVSCIAVRGTKLVTVDGGTYALCIENVETRATVSATKGNAGGIVAGGVCQTGYYPYIRNCTNRGSITSGGSAGGIVSRIETNNVKIPLRGFLIENCLNTGAINGGFEAGGIFGDIINGQVATKIRNCVNRGTVHAGTLAGGIIGAVRWGNLTVTDCTNYGEVTAGQYKGYCYGLLTGGGKEENITGFINYRVPGVLLHGYQLGKIEPDENGVSRRAVRLVASVDSLEYRAVGFRVTAKYTRDGEEKTQRLPEQVCGTVFDSLLAVEEAKTSVVTAEELRGTGYLYALVLDGLDVSIGTLELTVTPYYVSVGGDTTDGAKQTFTVSLA